MNPLFPNCFSDPPTTPCFVCFGCTAYPLLRPYLPHKLAFKSKQCVFLGFSPHHKGYWCLDPVTHRVYLSRNVVFDETLFPAQHRPLLPPSPQLPLPEAPSVAIQLPTNFTPLPINPGPDSSSHSTPTQSTSAPPASPTVPHSSPPSPPPLTDCSESNIPHSLSIASVSSLQVVPATSSPQDSPSAPATHQMVTRSKTGSLRPNSYADFQLFYSTRHPVRALHSPLVSEPTCFSDQLASLKPPSHPLGVTP